MKQSINAIHKGEGTNKIVFIHGNMASAKWWKPAMNALAKEYEMLAVNLRGFGDSPNTAEQVLLTDHARDLYELTQSHDFRQFAVVGHSLGGGVAMQLAADYPELLTGMVLVDSTPIDGIRGIDYDILQTVVSNKELAMASLKETLVKALAEDFLSELLADLVRALPAVIPNTKALENADFTSAAKAFAKPVLVVHGANDVLVPVAESEKAVLAYPNAILKIIPGVGHNPQVEDSEAFIAVLRGFVNSL